MLDINKNKGFIIAIGGAVVLLIAGIVLWRSAVGKAQEAADEIISAQEQYQSIIQKYSGEPTKKLVAAYKQKSEDLGADYFFDVTVRHLGKDRQTQYLLIIFFSNRT